MSDVDRWRKESSRWLPVVGQSAYRRYAPALFNFSANDRALETWFLRQISQPKIVIPEQDLYFFDDGYAADLTFAYDNCQQTLSVSLADAPHTLTFQEIRDLTPGEMIPRIDSEAAFIFKHGKSNYGHLLVDILPKLENLIAANVTGIPLIVPSIQPPLDTLFREIIQLAYASDYPLYEMRAPLVQAKHLIIPGPVSNHNEKKQKSSTVLRFVQRIIDRLDLRTTSPSRRLYVSRSRINNRRMENEPEIEELAKKFGFEIIHPQQMTFEDQARTFAEAKCIVGPSGAALTNIMFAPSTAKIGMIDRGLGGLFYYDLACLKQQEFAWFFAKPLARFSTEALHGPWVCDADMMRVAFSHFL